MAVSRSAPAKHDRVAQPSNADLGIDEQPVYSLHVSDMFMDTANFDGGVQVLRVLSYSIPAKWDPDNKQWIAGEPAWYLVEFWREKASKMAEALVGPGATFKVEGVIRKNGRWTNRQTGEQIWVPAISSPRLVDDSIDTSGATPYEQAATDAADDDDDI